MRMLTTAVLTAAALTCTAGPVVATAEASAADKAAITKAVKTVAAGKPTKSCAGLTPAFLKISHRTEQQCEQYQQDELAILRPSIKVLSVSSSGNRAKAKVSEHQSNGTITGTWELTRSGKTWRVSLIEADFRRADWNISLGRKYGAGSGDGDPLANKAYRACGLKGLLNRSDKQFLAFTYQWMTLRNDAFGKAFSACSSKAPGGKSPFRTIWETGLRQGFASSGAPPEVAECLIGKMRTTLDEPTLINATEDGPLSPDSPASKRWSAKYKVAIQACNKSGSASSVRSPRTIVRRTPVH